MTTATHGSQGLRLLTSKWVDAVILEYYLNVLDGAAIADEIKQVRPRLPIVMIAESLDLPQGALRSVDAPVTGSDGPRMLLETIYSVLQTKDRLHFEASFAEQPVPLEETAPNVSKKQILVVDHDPTVRKSIVMSLNAAGYDVTAAEDGFHALSELRKTLPDLVLSDLDMPGMSGLELLSVVRRRFPQMSTVAMSSAYAGEELPFGVIADGFFAKGGESRHLLRTIQSLLRTTTDRISDHHGECAPVWIPRNGNDPQGMPYVVLTCAECLRAYPMNLGGQSAGEVLEISCRFCQSRNRYIIQTSSHGALQGSVRGLHHFRV